MSQHDARVVVECIDAAPQQLASVEIVGRRPLEQLAA